MDIISGFITPFLEKVLGFFINRRSKKPKLLFKLVSTTPSELLEKRFRSSTSNSEYTIDVYNLGADPYILERFSLTHRRKLILDYFINDDDNTIQPYKHKKCILMEQDADALTWHQKNSKLKKCTVIAFDIQGKRHSTEMDIECLSFNSSFSPEESIVALDG
jgi:hypothetical protein